MLSILVLAAVGTAFFYEDELGLSHAGVMLLKTVHIYAGYVFAINLLVLMLAQLKPGSKDFVVPEKYNEMGAFRKLVKEIHEIIFLFC